MLQLYINKKEVELPSDFEIEIQYDNPYFSKNSDATLDVEIPIKGANNKRIFSNLQRGDVTKSNYEYDAQVIKNAEIVFSGKAYVTQVTGETVTLQFIASKDAGSIFSDETYIDKMDLQKAKLKGEPQKIAPATGDAWKVHDEYVSNIFNSSDECDVVVWGYRNFDENKEDSKTTIEGITFEAGGYIYIWPDRTTTNPYLIWVIKSIANALGYSIGENYIEKSWLKNIFIKIKNYSTTKYNVSRTEIDITKYMPHWTLSTFFDELEKLCAVVVIDNGDKTMDIVDMVEYYNDETERIYVEENDVLDEYEVDIDDNTNEKDISSGNIEYGGDYLDKYIKINDSIDLNCKKKEFDNYEELINAFDSTKEDEKKRTIFIDKSTQREYIAYTGENTATIKEINTFGALKRTKKIDNDITLKFVPVNSVDFDKPMYLSAGGGMSTQKSDSEMIMCKINSEEFVTESVETDEEGINYPIQTLIEEGTEVDTAEDEEDNVVEIAIYDGSLTQIKIGSQFDEYDKFPIIWTDYARSKTCKDLLSKMSLSLHDVCDMSIGHRLAALKKIDSDIPYYIKFISKRRLKARAIFVIKNQSFVAEYLKTTYNQTGVNIIEGKFYKVNM
jgi:hypothetical protein